MAILTGIAIASRDHAFHSTSRGFDWVLAVKGVLVGLLVAGAYLHDYVLGPGLARQIREGRPQSLRPLLRGIGWFNFALDARDPDARRGARRDPRLDLPEHRHRLPAAHPPRSRGHALW